MKDSRSGDTCSFGHFPTHRHFFAYAYLATAGAKMHGDSIDDAPLAGHIDLTGSAGAEGEPGG